MKSLTKIPSYSLCWVALTICIGISIQAQSSSDAVASVEYGKIDEIIKLNLHSVFIYCEDLTIRDMFAKELEKDPWFKIAERIEDADFYLGFEVKDQITGASVSFGSVTTNRTYYGELIVMRRTVTKDKVRGRVLWHTTKRQAWSGGITLSRNPAVNAIHSFLSDLKKARKTTPTPDSNESSAKASTRSPPKPELPAEELGLSLSGFSKMEIGVSYSDVVNILKNKGVEVGASESSGHQITTYRWLNKTHRGVIQAVFYDDKLRIKTQSGLEDSQ